MSFRDIKHQYWDSYHCFAIETSNVFQVDEPTWGHKKWIVIHHDSP